MRYKYFKVKPIYKLDGEVITKEELNNLHKHPERLSYFTIAFLFDVEPVEVFMYAESMGIGHRMEDRCLYREADAIEQKAKKINRDLWDKQYREEKAEKKKLLRQEAERIYGKKRPQPVVHKVGDKVFKDYDLVNLHDRRINSIVEQLGDRYTAKKEITYVRSVDLSAMRLHRGLDMVKFSQVSKIPYKDILYYEKTRGSHVPKEISDIYKKVLNISNKEFRNIIKCLAGERKTMFEEERRNIPDSVRQYVWKRDGGKCKKCSQKKYLHFHHIERYSDGGKHEAKNIRLLCVSCHAEEHLGEKGYHMLKAQADKLMGGEKNWVSSN